MLLELNEVLLENEPQTLSLVVESGRLACLTGGTSQRRTRWLHAVMGFENVTHGYISIDGEPLEAATIGLFRQLMAYAPGKMETLGEVVRYEPPSVQDVFNLKANRERPISNGILVEEMKRTGGDMADDRTRLLAVAVLLDKSVVLVDQPSPETVGYLCGLARQGRTVLVASDEQAFVNASHIVVELSSEKDL